MEEINTNSILIAFGNEDYELAKRISSVLNKEVGQFSKMYNCSKKNDDSEEEKLIENSSTVLLVASDSSKSNTFLAEFAKKSIFVNKEVYLFYCDSKPTWAADKWRIEDYMFADFENPNEMSVIYASLRDKFGEVRLPGDPVGQEINVVSEHINDLYVYRIKNGIEEDLGPKFRLDKGGHTVFFQFKTGKYKNYVIEKIFSINNPTGIINFRVKDVFLDIEYAMSMKEAKKEQKYWSKMRKINKKGSEIFSFLFSQFNIVAILCVVVFFAIIANTFFIGDLLKYTLILLGVLIVVTTAIYYFRFSGISEIIDKNQKTYGDIVLGNGKLFFKDNASLLVDHLHGLKK